MTNRHIRRFIGIIAAAATIMAAPGSGFYTALAETIDTRGSFEPAAELQIEQIPSLDQIPASPGNAMPDAIPTDATPLPLNEQYDALKGLPELPTQPLEQKIKPVEVTPANPGEQEISANTNKGTVAPSQYIRPAVIKQVTTIAAGITDIVKGLDNRIANPEAGAHAGAELAEEIGAERLANDLQTDPGGFRSVDPSVPLPRSNLYRKLLAEQRTPTDKKKAGYKNDWSAIKFYKPAREFTPKTEQEISDAITYARENNLKVSIAGTRHSMGGQAMQDGTVFLDMTDFRGARFHYDTQTVTVRSGTNWIDLQDYLLQYGRTVRVKQAASVFTIGGSISANIHGEDFRYGTIGNTVKALRIMQEDKEGNIKIVTASRDENRELFIHAIGGYGLFGLILEAELYTAPDEKYRQKFQIMPADEVPQFVKETILPNSNIHFFLTELSISPLSFLKEALVFTWEKVTQQGDKIPPFTPADTSKFHVLLGKIPYRMATHDGWFGKLGKIVLWTVEKYLQPLILQEYVSRNDALTLDYDMNRIPAITHSQVLQEIFVPMDRLNEARHKVAALCKKYKANLVYGSHRIVLQDTLTALPFAKTDSLSMVIFRDQKLGQMTAAEMAMFYIEVAAAAKSVGGRPYLTYQLPFTWKQLQAFYPEIDNFFEVRDKYDPHGRFSNELSKKHDERLHENEGTDQRWGSGIEHVVVLMLENRSFDHMLGFLNEDNPKINGLTGKESNPIDPSNPSKGVVQVTRGAQFFSDINPGHEPDDVHTQMDGNASAAHFEPTMNGFVANYLEKQPKDWTPGQKLAGAKNIMTAFAPEQVPVFAKLAKEFVVADRWFSSAPTSTFPNRAFLHTGTANGHLHSASTVSDPEFKKALFGNMYGTRTLYDNLVQAAHSWKIYYHDIIWSFLIPGIRKYPENLARMKRFKKDVANNKLPAYSLIEPAYINTPLHKANDDDAPHDIREGQRLVADVYNAIRSNDELWKKTLLVITYDEHGGFYDHVVPPATVNPDGKNSEQPPFDFKQLGIRVPAILVSPWLPKGVVDHAIYDHTSILKFVEDRFGLPRLSERDKQANTFGQTFTLAEPRDDTPVKLIAPTSGSETNSDPRLYDPAEPQGIKAVIGAFLLGTGMKSVYYGIYLPRILARRAKRFAQWIVNR